jgi:hypothetical protein
MASTNTNINETHVRSRALAGRAYRDLAEQRGDHMVLIVLHAARAATAGAGWSPNGVIPDLCRDDLLLEAGQQLLRFGRGQTQVGDIGEISGPFDLHDVSGLSLTFSVAMRLQHLKQIAAALPADRPARVAAKTVIVAEVERLHWRIWNGKAKNARKSIDRIRAVMSHFQGEAGGRNSIARSRKLWTALHALDGYLTSQSAWLVNYAERHRAGWRVGTALTEGTANFLVNRRMNKAQQMRGRDAAPICCFRFVAPSIMERSARVSDRSSGLPTIHTYQ